MEIVATNSRNMDYRSHSEKEFQVPRRKSRPSEATVSFDLDRHLTSVPSLESTQASKCDPLKILIPVTDAVLIIMAIIFILAMGIVAMVVIMAIIKSHFSTDKGDWSFWTDD